MKPSLKRMIADIEAEVEYTRTLTGRKALDPGVMAVMARVPREQFVPGGDVPTPRLDMHDPFDRGARRYARHADENGTEHVTCAASRGNGDGPSRAPVCRPGQGDKGQVVVRAQQRVDGAYRSCREHQQAKIGRDAVHTVSPRALPSRAQRARGYDTAAAPHMRANR